MKTYRAWLCGWLVFAACQIAGAAEFPLRDGDTWVMVGDSITAQHLHSNYFEAFCFARYPKLKFQFRNSGVGGDTIPRVLARYDWDVAPWKPTVVSVELGMNDQGGFTVEQFIANMGELTQKIKATSARPVIFTASPINNGGTTQNLNGNNRLNDYAIALKKLSAEQQLPYADQFHAVLDVWGKNKPNEGIANVIASLRGVTLADDLAGVEHLRAFIAAQEKNPRPPVSMQGDPVHPGPCGQLTMAAALLKELGAEGFVSSAVLSADGKVTSAKGCTIGDVVSDGGKLSFTRLDETLPFPIPAEARVVFPLFPTILELSQYHLQVTGLAAGSYALQVDGKPSGTFSAEELGAGVNLTALAQGPIADKGLAVLNAVNQKEGLVNQWRGQSRVQATTPTPDLKATLDKTTESVIAADAKIREAATPAKLRFELAPAAK